MSRGSLEELISNPPDLPVAHRLSAVRDALPGVLVVQAPPGTGKTTLIPPLVATQLGKSSRVVVTQPRRVAARAAARRIASLLGEPIGHTVGFSVRGESRVSAQTRIEMVTPGVLVRRLQRDPELVGVGAVILDEVHERHIDSDLAMALCVQVRETIREDLILIAMSATVEAQRTAALLGGTVVDIPGAIHPVELRYAEPPRGSEPLGALGTSGATGVRREFVAHVAATARRALSETNGDVLVFVPGVREVDDAAARLVGCGAEVMKLHGSLSAKEQDAVLSGGKLRRVIVSTAIAESSLTVPGVRAVVDAGLSREPRMDYSKGVGGLVTVLEARAAGVQRAGRAGREGPGVAYRCMSENTWARLAEHAEPEIRTADLVSFCLEVACWGAPRGTGLALIDPAPPAALDAAEATLTSLGALDSGRPTPLGVELARLPVSPRVGRALLVAAGAIGPRRAAEVCALIEDDIRIPGADLAHGWRTVAAQSTTWKHQADRLEKIARQVALQGTHSIDIPSLNRGANHTTGSADDALAVVVGLAYPERIARVRTLNGQPTNRYLLANGIGATLPTGSPLAGEVWLAIAQLDRGQGRSDAVIRAAVPLDRDFAEVLAASLIEQNTHIRLHHGRLQGLTVRSLGAIELSVREEAKIDLDMAREFVTARISSGELPLTWTEGAVSMRERLAFLHMAMGDPWPDVSDEALAARLEEWAGPELNQFIRGKKLQAIRAEQFDRILPWPQAARIGELAPERIQVPTGSTSRVDYSSGRPIVRLRLQEAFGWRVTPRIADGRVPITLELLSPAQRPLAVTDDVESFWRGAYVQVRAEMRGRYPHHPCPEDPLTAEPTRRAKPRT